MRAIASRVQRPTARPLQIEPAMEAEPSAERAGDRSKRESPLEADNVTLANLDRCGGRGRERRRRGTRERRAGAPMARSAQGMRAIASRVQRPTARPLQIEPAMEAEPSAERAGDRSKRESPLEADNVTLANLDRCGGRGRERRRRGTRERRAGAPMARSAQGMRPGRVDATRPTTRRIRTGSGAEAEAAARPTSGPPPSEVRAEAEATGCSDRRQRRRPSLPVLRQSARRTVRVRRAGTAVSRA